MSLFYLSSLRFTFFSKETNSLTDVHQSMALHMFRMLYALTVHIMWSVPSNIFRGNITWKPSCDFQLFPKYFRLVSLGMCLFFVTLKSSLHIPNPFVQQMYHRHVSFNESAMLITSHQIPNPVHSLCYETRLHTLGSVFSHSNMPLGADCRRRHAVHTSVCAHARFYWLHRAPLLPLLTRIVTTISSQ